MRRETKFKILIIAGTLACLAFLMLFLFSGDNYDLLKSLFTDDLSNEQLQTRLDDFGPRGYITVIILSVVQVVSTFLPSQPVQILAGLTFGFPIGLLCCTVGTLLGASVIYLLQKQFGDKLRNIFSRTLHLDLEKISQSGKGILVVVILFLVPVLPYGVVCFFAASMGLRYRRYILATLIGTLPTACLGVGLGRMTITSNWEVTVCVFAVLIALAVLIAYNRKWLFGKLDALASKPKYSSKTKVRKCNGFVLNLFYVFFRMYYFFMGIRIKKTNKCGKKLKGPCIVLCNHGAFIDFVYAATLLRKSRPHFVVARLYFYHKLLGNMMRTLGAFPKSMFAMDIESTKNCLKVLHDGGVLTMMPEARLSTVGRFEDIQQSTYSFLKKAEVPIYTIKLRGDYLAKPKWGKGLRRGAVVEAELEMLFTAQQIHEQTEDAIKKGVEDRLYYDEFAWLARRPKIHYKSKRMAEGLENILSVCPKCKGRHTITTSGNEIRCETCGSLTTIDDRYGFASGFQFENFAQWYDWQKALIREEILKDPEYALQSKVELRLPGDGKSLTRHAGEGVCTLTREGLTYEGTRDGEDCKVFFSITKIYRLLFGAGENFEVYNGSEIYYFVPAERRSAVDWYITSMILNDEERAKDLTTV